MQEYNKLNSRFLIQLALFDCNIITCTAKQNGFPPGVIQVARREKKALYKVLYELKRLTEKKREEAIQLIRQNQAWIMSLIDVWMAIR